MDMQLIGDLPVAITLKVKRLAGISSRELSERYQRHFRACMVAIEGVLNAELRELADEARKHFGVFEETHNIPRVEEPLKASAKFEDLPPGNEIPAPTFEGSLDGYDYISLEHHFPLVEGGRYTVRGADGKLAEIDIEITPGQTSPTSE
jgi:hypothetical protein